MSKLRYILKVKSRIIAGELHGKIWGKGRIRKKESRVPFLIFMALFTASRREKNRLELEEATRV